MTMSSEYLSVDEAVRELGISRQRLIDLIQNGEVPAEKRPEGKPYVWYLRRAVVERLEENKRFSKG